MKNRSRSRHRGQGAEDAHTPQIGASASSGDWRLRAYQVGALPLLNHFFERLKLSETLRAHLPPDDPRQELPTERMILLLVRNVLVAREPLYGVPDWVAGYSPELFDMYHCDLPLLHDDRLGGCLAKLFAGTTLGLILAVVRSAIQEFGVSLNEMHNDSTTLLFHGDYPQAARPGVRAGRARPAITWGHSKDHRPDLKQLLFTLTLANDGGIPVYFQVDSGNTTDDTTHRQTWDVLHDLVGGPDFLYVADCKLASRENLQYIATRGGRFVTVLPATRREDGEFRRRLREEPTTITWEACWVRAAEPSDESSRKPGKTPPPPVDVIRVGSQAATSSDGFRLLWFHSQRKAELDEQARAQRCQRAIVELEELQQRLTRPRTRFRKRAKVEQAVQEILATRQVEALLKVTIGENEHETFRQQGRGRPTAQTKYHRQVATRFTLSWQLDEERWRAVRAEDGVFPLLTNERTLSPREVLEAYKRQPKIEKRFSQLKTDFAVAPVFLKNPDRVMGLLTVYFLALLVQALIERELRNALQQAAQAVKATSEKRDAGSMELYPEGRRCHRPTARRVLDTLEPLRRYEIHHPDQEPQLLFDDLTPTQQRLVQLLGLKPHHYGR